MFKTAKRHIPVCTKKNLKSIPPSMSTDMNKKTMNPMSEKLQNSKNIPNLFITISLFFFLHKNY